MKYENADHIFRKNCCMKSDDLCRKDMYIFHLKEVVRNGKVFRDKKRSWKKEIRKYMRNIIPAKVLMRFQGEIIYREVLFTEY